MTRMSRSNKKRETFKVDSLLNEKLKSLKSNSCFGDFMTMVFGGFVDKSQANSNEIRDSLAKLTDKVNVEVILLKIAHKKRKESSSSILNQIGAVEVEVNPKEGPESGHKQPVVSLSTELFDADDGPVTQMVLFRIQTLMPKQENQIFSSELMIFDKLGRCLLTEGEYQLTLQELVPKQNSNCSPKKYSSWENLSLFNSDSSGFEDQFEKNPTLKFRLYWTEKSYTGTIDRPQIAQISSCSNKENNLNTTNNNNSIVKKEPIDEDNNNPDNASMQLQLRKSQAQKSHDIFGISDTDLQITFHFVYNNVSRQTTKATASMDCPWCSLNCVTLYSLLKHLKLCHARFNFNFVKVGTTARIEVSINETFDGSYTGSPNNLTSPAGYAFSRSGPVRRTIVTHILVCRPRRLKPSLTEFVEAADAENDPNGSQRPYITGHNRLYHHTMTCLPVHPKELDIDSEGECDPPWLQQKTMMMIDEFTDVNEGEKELMKMWNLHVMKHGFVGDCQIPLACEMFVEFQGLELVRKNLYRNFVLHMCSLFDYGLVAPEALYKTIQRVQKILNDFAEGKAIVQGARQQHLVHWNEVGYAKYQQQLKEKEAAVEEKKPVLLSAVTNGGPSTRNKDSFQKPKTECRGVAIKSASQTTGIKTEVVSSVMGKKKTAATSNGRIIGSGLVSENPAKRKLERGEFEMSKCVLKMSRISYKQCMIS